MESVAKYWNALVTMTGGYIGAAAVVGLGVMLVFFILALMF